MENGKDKDDKTEMGPRSIFCYQIRFDFSRGFSINNY